MIPKFRAWVEPFKRMEIPTTIEFTEGDIDYICFDYEGVGYSPNKAILMQSTGLFDENGVEIFEGDVVRTTRFLGRADETGGFYEYDKEFVGVIKQLEGTWVVDTGKDAVSLWTEIEENEVIGNIYENPDLVEVKL